ncbi:peptidase [Brevundimonas bacteroides]|uniref:peptidase n=1 Tax=Brevundimonas bacteroides TaxID=74311 RepID=UPI001B80397C|nr:peptidase [Brevundimonas bacteroides]
MKTTSAALLALIVAAAPAVAAVQSKSVQQVDPSARATYGDYRLNAGFPDDPYIIYVDAGGDIDASNVASGCAGMVSYAPDAQVTYRAGSLPFIIRTDSDTDTTLLVNGPDGSWYCDDDSGGNLNAQLRWGSPPSGVYDIWVGTFGGGVARAELQISELDSTNTNDNNYNDNNNYSDSAGTFGEITLRAGFSPDPHTVRLTAGGEVDSGPLGDGCSGNVADYPDYVVNYTSGSFPLIFGVDSDRDTTLVVADQNDRYWCDDDGGNEGLNPQVYLSNPRSGTYRVWVGTFSQGNAPATLYVTELEGNAP